MTAESGGSYFDLPEDVVQVLPSDPFEQLDVALRSSRGCRPSATSSELRAEIAEKDNLIAELQSHVESLDASLSETADKLVRAEQDKESLLKENASLSNTVRKLNRDVSKLEVFRKTLMQSLQEDDDKSGGSPDIVARIQSQSSLTSTSQFGGTFNMLVRPFV
ncbi:hypothetical protein L195_g042910 [Trifolium pratense]|uniref:Uncharacterized protein n=1 Tax=Trifolium pratense TaxID=57577 RepID=A0A2K3M7S5_TRIPR|nr:hypothetical protein L195_g042595 [Trifolium pratense]PNX86828.1 hypothetical protein L195_g042910 [Trifolium pratense]